MRYVQLSLSKHTRGDTSTVCIWHSRLSCADASGLCGRSRIVWRVASVPVHPFSRSAKSQVTIVYLFIWVIADTNVLREALPRRPSRMAPSDDSRVPLPDESRCCFRRCIAGASYRGRLVHGPRDAPLQMKAGEMRLLRKWAKDQVGQGSSGPRIKWATDTALTKARRIAFPALHPLPAGLSRRNPAL